MDSGILWVPYYGRIHIVNVLLSRAFGSLSMDRMPDNVWQVECKCNSISRTVHRASFKKISKFKSRPPDDEHPIRTFPSMINCSRKLCAIPTVRTYKRLRLRLCLRFDTQIVNAKSRCRLYSGLQVKAFNSKEVLTNKFLLKTSH